LYDLALSPIYSPSYTPTSPIRHSGRSRDDSLCQLSARLYDDLAALRFFLFLFVVFWRGNNCAANRLANQPGRNCMACYRPFTPCTTLRTGILFDIATAIALATGDKRGITHAQSYLGLSGSREASWAWSDEPCSLIAIIFFSMTGCLEGSRVYKYPYPSGGGVKRKHLHKISWA
jgi:hypothetical protein